MDTDEPPRYLLDTNVYDQLVSTPEIQRRAIEAHESGRMELLLTHVQVDELTPMPDEEKRDAALAIPGTATDTYGFVLTFSRLDHARLGEPATIEAIRNGSLKHTHDALLASTAEYEGAVLVTDDDRLQKRARRLGIEVWEGPRFVAELMA